MPSNAVTARKPIILVKVESYVIHIHARKTVKKNPEFLGRLVGWKLLVKS